MAELRVTGNSPRLLEEGAAPPPPADMQQAPEELEVPHLYWTADKAQHVVARVLHAASKFYGPSVKAADWELELIGEPAANVMNDWMPLKSGPGADRTSNLIALAAVVAIIVALRLPDILEVHGVEFPWAKRQRLLAQQNQQQTSSSSQQPAYTSPPAAPPPAGTTAGTFEPQLVGGTATTSGDDKLREQVYGGGTVGGNGAFAGTAG